MTGDTQKLNLIFHGMFAFVIWRDHIEVLAPEEEDHVYKAGAWGRERRLRQGGVYTLQGANPGAKRPALNPKENLVLSNLTQIERDPETLFFSVILPFPESMTGLRRVKLDSTRRLFGGAASSTVSATSLPLVQVMTYAIDDVTKLCFPPLPVWLPKPDGHSFLNLHIWAESDSFFTDAERDHPIRGFERLTRLFPGLDLQLLYSTGAPMDGSVQIPGMEVWEQATLRERSRLLFGVPQDPSTARGAEVTNCLTMHVDNP
jgi:hypothetical protein